MNNEEAKFILGAYRPDGSDAADPVFAEALAQAARDPALQAWLEGQRSVDRAVVAKLQAIAPPAGLRDAILAGARVSRARPGWWVGRGWLAAAAAVAVFAVLAVALGRRGAESAEGNFALLAARDMAEAHAQHVGFPAGLSALQTTLAQAPVPLTGALPIEVGELRRKGCRSVTWAGRDVFEVCFRRDGTWYHLYVARRDDFRVPTGGAVGRVAEHAGFAATTWADAKNVYALVADTPEALRRVL